MDVISFKPFTANKPRPGDSKGAYPMIEDEIFHIPQQYYYKLGYKKINSDIPTEITYRRYSNTCLEEFKFKLPFTEQEKSIILQKLNSYKDIANRILSEASQDLSFEQPFRTEHLIRGKTQTGKNQNSLFENFRDKSKYTFSVEAGIVKANETPLVSNNIFDKMQKNESMEAMRQRLSKGQFKYLMRIYNHKMFDQHINRLEKAIALFSDIKSEEIQKIKNGKLIMLNK